MSVFLLNALTLRVSIFAVYLCRIFIFDNITGVDYIHNKLWLYIRVPRVASVALRTCEQGYDSVMLRGGSVYCKQTRHICRLAIDREPSGNVPLFDI